MQSRLKVEKKGRDDRRRKKKKAEEVERDSVALTPYDNTFNVKGVLKIVLSSMTQKAIGCVVGEDLTTDYPWIFIKKEKIEDNLELHEESSEFLPFKQYIIQYPEEEILIGFDKPTEDDKLEFFFCSTTKAKNHVVKTLEQQKEELQERLKQSVHKKAGKWKSCGSDIEVDDSIIKNFRPLIEVEVESKYPLCDEKKKFKLRLVEDAKDGYMELLPGRFPIKNVYRKIIDTATQVGLSTVDHYVQTNPTYPKNIWTQYKYEYDTPKLDKKQNQNLDKFLTQQVESMSEILHLNEHINLYSDDYANIYRFFDRGVVIINRDLISFRDVITTKGKLVTDVTLDPFYSGILAASYATWSPNYFTKESPQQTQRDIVKETTFGDHWVLIWCNSDTLKPKLYLRSYREVCTIRHCPIRPDILIGGLTNGQIVIWDMKGKLQEVESKEILTPSEQKHRIIMHASVSWMLNPNDINVLQPTVISSLENSHKDLVTGIRFVMQDYKISRNGLVMKCDEEEESLQMMTCALDGSILIWDLLSRPDSDKAPKPKKGLLNKLPSALTTGISEFRTLNMSLTPMYKIYIKDKITQVPFPLSCINIKNQNFTFQARNPETGDDYLQRTYFDTSKSPDPYVFDNVIQMNDMLGHFFQTKFEGHTFDQGQKINFEDVKYDDFQLVHDGPITTCVNNKLDTSCVLTIGGRVFAIWCTTEMSKPIFWRKCSCRYVGGVWSSAQVGALVLAREDTYIETWTLLFKTSGPGRIVRMSGNPIIDYYSDYRREHVKKSTFATTDIFGAVRIYRIPPGRRTYKQVDLDLAGTVLERTFKRKQIFNTWLANWKLLHGYTTDDQKQDVSTEKEKKEVKIKTTETGKVEKRNTTDIKSTKTKWAEKQEKMMYLSLLEKKKLNIEEIEKHKIPLQEMFEAQKLKDLKIKQMIGRKEELFDAAKKKVFKVPEVKRKTKYQVDCPPNVRGFMKQHYMKCYEAKIKETLASIAENKYHHRFEWGAMISQGKERRRTMSMFFGPDVHRTRSSKDQKKQIEFGFNKILISNIDLNDFKE